MIGKPWWIKARAAEPPSGVQEARSPLTARRDNSVSVSRRDNSVSVSMPRRGIQEDENSPGRYRDTHACRGYFQSSASLLLNSS